LTTIYLKVEVSVLTNTPLVIALITKLPFETVGTQYATPFVATLGVATVRNTKSPAETKEFVTVLVPATSVTVPTTLFNPRLKVSIFSSCKISVEITDALKVGGILGGLDD
jgi:hypothetical protein